MSRTGGDEEYRPHPGDPWHPEWSGAESRADEEHPFEEPAGGPSAPPGDRHGRRGWFRRRRAEEALRELDDGKTAPEVRPDAARPAGDDEAGDDASVADEQWAPSWDAWSAAPDSGAEPSLQRPFEPPEGPFWTSGLDAGEAAGESPPAGGADTAAVDDTQSEAPMEPPPGASPVTSPEGEEEHAGFRPPELAGIEDEARPADPAGTGHEPAAGDRADDAFVGEETGRGLGWPAHREPAEDDLPGWPEPTSEAGHDGELFPAGGEEEGLGGEAATPAAPSWADAESAEFDGGEAPGTDAAPEGIEPLPGEALWDVPVAEEPGPGPAPEGEPLDELPSPVAPPRPEAAVPFGPVPDESVWEFPGEGAEPAAGAEQDLAGAEEDLAGADAGLDLAEAAPSVADDAWPDWVDVPEPEGPAAEEAGRGFAWGSVDTGGLEPEWEESGDGLPGDYGVASREEAFEELKELEEQADDVEAWRAFAAAEDEGETEVGLPEEALAPEPDAAAPVSAFSGAADDGVAPIEGEAAVPGAEMSEEPLDEARPRWWQRRRRREPEGAEDVPEVPVPGDVEEGAAAAEADDAGRLPSAWFADLARDEVGEPTVEPPAAAPLPPLEEVPAAAERPPMAGEEPGAAPASIGDAEASDGQPAAPERQTSEFELDWEGKGWEETSAAAPSIEPAPEAPEADREPGAAPTEPAGIEEGETAPGADGAVADEWDDALGGDDEWEAWAGPSVRPVDPAALADLPTEELPFDYAQAEQDGLSDQSYSGAVTQEHRGLAEAMSRADTEETELQALAAPMAGVESGVVGFEDVEDLGTDEEYIAPAASDLGLRVVTGLVLVALLLGALWVGGEALAAFIALLLLVGLVEFYGTLRHVGLRPMALFGYLGAVAVYALAWFQGPIAIIGGLVGTTVVVYFVYALAPERRDALTNGSLTVLGVVWVVGTSAFAFPIVDSPDYRPLIFALVVCTVAMDVGAFFAGRSFGSRALAPVLSPNKTVEGLAGGVILTVLAAAAIGYLFEPFDLRSGVALGLVVAVAAPLGDLAESMVKRSLGVKDMGAVLPGHGGILDRVDAFLFAIPAAWALYESLGLLG